MNRTAIIGAGPAGLVAAKYMKHHGLEPTIFEQSESLGGQWSAGAAHSGVWPNMHTNTSRLMTAFSDFAHRDDAPMYASNQQMLAYLHAYVRRFELGPHLRLRTRVTRIERESSSDSWRVTHSTEDGAVRTETFGRVVIASGRYHHPRMPEVVGLESFSGAGGVTHTFDYQGPTRCRGMRVLVAGGSISALEIASDLAMQGDVSVISSQRKQRYVLSKLIGGVPVEQLAFTRFAALAEETFPIEDVARGLKDFIVTTCGRPEQFGALAASDSVLEAGITLNQNFLPFVAEGRIAVKPWMTNVRGNCVSFSDGTSEEVDALVFGTGFHLQLPFLATELERVLDVDGEHIDLYAHTLHPELPGLAFLGLYDIVGPALPVLELQARWLTYLWAGLRPMPQSEEMRDGIESYRAGRHLPASVPMHRLAIQFARLAGVEPSLEKFPHLGRQLLFGPLCPQSFRLSGPDALPDAAERAVRAAAMAAAAPDAQPTPEQEMQIRALAKARDDEHLVGLFCADRSMQHPAGLRQYQAS